MPALKYLENVTTLKLDQSLCNGCTICTIVCPHAVLEMAQKKAEIVYADRCMECGACATNCDQSALSVRAGVGCAYAIIMGSIRGTEPDCGCSTDSCC
ncbi:MAG: mercury methylation ferredoxin HgcB [candidate division Zixibacteria bacterium]